MSKWQQITRRTWCSRNALPDSKSCRWHQDGPAWTPAADDYQVADFKLRQAVGSDPSRI